MKLIIFQRNTKPLFAREWTSGKGRRQLTQKESFNAKWFDLIILERLGLSTCDFPIGFGNCGARFRIEPDFQQSSHIQNNRSYPYLDTHSLILILFEDICRCKGSVRIVRHGQKKTETPVSRLAFSCENASLYDTSHIMPSDYLVAPEVASRARRPALALIVLFILLFPLEISFLFAQSIWKWICDGDSELLRQSK